MSISEREYVYYVRLLVAFVIIGIVFMIGAWYYDYSSVRTAREQEYQCFYNGQEVDIDNIDIYQYNRTFDKDNKRVYLSDRAGGKHTAVCPVIVPVH